MLKEIWLAILEAVLPKKVSREITLPKPVIIKPMPLAYLFDTRQKSQHSVRVICDEMLPLERTVVIDGKSYLPKDVIYACIEQESDFYNYLPNGNPTVCHNKNKAGKITSSDWGIIQCNDFYHIGVGKDFPSVDYVLTNPDVMVRWMIQMYKAGRINMWSSYTSGAFKKFLPQV